MSLSNKLRIANPFFKLVDIIKVPVLPNYIQILAFGFIPAFP